MKINSSCNLKHKIVTLKFFPKVTGVNFTNILRAAFTLIDPESVKNYS